MTNFWLLICCDFLDAYVVVTKTRDSNAPLVLTPYVTKARELGKFKNAYNQQWNCKMYWTNSIMKIVYLVF